MRHAQRRRPVAQSRRLHAVGVTEERDHPGLVVGHPGRDQIAQLLRHQRGVVGEALGRVARGPAADLLERLRQVPVVERGDRLDTALEQALHKLPVEADPGRVRRPESHRQDARPRDREAVALHSQRLHQVQVAAPAVVVVARHVGRVAVGDRARAPSEAVPDRLAAAVLAHRALDLERRRGHAEAEVGRVAVRAAHPFTAPAVSPRTSQRCAMKNAISTGIVDTTPAAISWS